MSHYLGSNLSCNYLQAADLLISFFDLVTKSLSGFFCDE